MNDKLTIYEVGPRDGLQNEAAMISTADKVALIDGLVDAGLRHIEVTSFVHPDAVPQLADADEVMRSALAAHSDASRRLVGLVFNQRGYQRALDAGARAIAFGVSVSDTFSRRNTGMSAEELMAVTRSLVEQARRDDLWTRVYISAAWVCPFEGPTAPRKTIAFAERVAEMDVDEVAVADTIGYADPLEVGRLVRELGRYIPLQRLAVHLHDTQALGLANATTAIEAGVRILDTSIGGLGGCPFAPGAAGNLATEDLVFLAYKMGLGTGVDFKKLWSVVCDLERRLGRSIGGRIRPWWESMQDQEPSFSLM